MQRKQRHKPILAPAPSRFIVFDTEDDSRELLAAGRSGFDKRITLVAAIADDGAEFLARGDGAGRKFLRWLETRPERYCYAHNIAYDLGNLFGDELDALDWTLVGGRTIRAVWGRKTFLDSFNIWPMSAEKLGEAFGLEKLDFDPHSADYVVRDCEIILRAMQFAWQFCELCGVATLPATLGGLCVKVWRAFGGENPHCSEPLARAGLVGGRVELFKLVNGTADVCWTDINSLYPSAMLGEFPIAGEICSPRKLPEFGLVAATVRVPECEIAPLPWRDPASGRILYPWGRFAGVWTTHELRAAEARGARLEKVERVFGGNDSTPCYRTFVQKIYAARLAAGNEAERLFFKLLMNNLYGRLSVTGLIGRSVWRTPENRGAAGVPFGAKVLTSYQMPLSEECNWMHGAYVTSYGRLALLGYLETIGAGALIYTDTDSAIFDCPGRRIPFAVGPELGAMKLVSWESNCAVYAPKTYRVGNVWKAKGVPRRLARPFIETGRADFDLPFRVREAIAFFDRANERRLSVWRKVHKVLRATYDRKKIRGNRFYPCKVWEQG